MRIAVSFFENKSVINTSGGERTCLGKPILNDVWSNKKYPTPKYIMCHFAAMRFLLPPFLLSQNSKS